MSREEEFIHVLVGDQNRKKVADGGKLEDTFASLWSDIAGAKHASPSLQGADALKSVYPNHSLVMTMDYRMNPLSFPGAIAMPIDTPTLVTNLVFIPLARRAGSTPGLLADNVIFGSFKVAWDKYEFLVFTVQFPYGFGIASQTYILHDGPEEPARQMLLACGLWANDIHEEIWVFNQGFWSKDHGLWLEVQKGSWDDVILKDEFKSSLQKDIYGFFESERVYKDLAIPWKRGIIMHGPPGNGKTISIKVIMKTCEEKGFQPLYVKSFQSWMGEEASMAAVFGKARELSPCVIIIEDLDSLINNQNRSFFLNELDGLEGNDGLLVVGTTNHFDRLDPGLSTRPSRFDRKYLFDDPDYDERVLYAQYWQKKLESNSAIAFPDSLVHEVAELTQRFSFAYLKEVFVSSLVQLAGIDDGDKPEFATMLRRTIKTLRDQLDKDPKEGAAISRSARQPLPKPPTTNAGREADTGLVSRLASAARAGVGQRIFTTAASSEHTAGGSEHSFRTLMEGFSRNRAPPTQGMPRVWASVPMAPGNPNAGPVPWSVPPADNQTSPAPPF